MVKSNLINRPSKAREYKPDEEESDCGNTCISRINRTFLYRIIYSSEEIIHWKLIIKFEIIYRYKQENRKPP